MYGRDVVNRKCPSMFCYYKNLYQNLSNFRCCKKNGEKEKKSNSFVGYYVKR